MGNRLRGLIASIIIATAGLAAPADALSFQLIDASGSVAGTPAEQGFRIATDYWSSMLTSNVTVRLDIGYSALGANIIGQTSSTRTTLATSAVYSQLAATGNSALDAVAVSHLSPLTSAGGLQAITSGYTNSATKMGVNTAAQVYDRDNSANNLTLGVNTATAKALGFAVDPTQRDAAVTFSSNFAFDFDPSDGIASGSMDFIGVAIHEIGHALGFTSGVDTYDYVAATTPNTNLNGTAGLFSTLDLFRYSSDPNNLVPGSGAALDLSVGGSPFFSIDGAASFASGTTFATGAYKGNGQQASHWSDSVGCSVQIGILDPTFCYGQMGIVTNNDIAAFDAMGWNVGYDVLTHPSYSASTADIYRQFATAAASVPEPGSWAIFAIGFGLTGAMARRRHAPTLALARLS